MDRKLDNCYMRQHNNTVQDIMDHERASKIVFITNNWNKIIRFLSYGLFVV